MNDVLSDRDFRPAKWINVYVVVVAGPYGLLLLLAPQVQAGLVQLPPVAGTLLMMRFVGASEIYATVLSLFALRTRSRTLSRALGFSNGIMDGLLCVITIMAMINRELPSTAVIDLTLTGSHSILGFWLFRRLGSKPVAAT